MSSSKSGLPVAGCLSISWTKILLLLLAVATCAITSTNSAPSAAAPPFVPDDKPLNSESEVPRVRTARYVQLNSNNTQEDTMSKSKSTPQINTNPSCFSDVSNQTIPAAHIKGHGLKFSASVPGSIPSGYQQRWRCTEIQNGPLRQSVHAFVDGGMCFNQTDKTLRVPTCGYYMVTSQVLFNIHSLAEPRTISHLMRFRRNCSGSYSTDAQSIVVTGKSSMGPFTLENHHAGVATTYTSDIIKLCSGGSIWIEIPDGDNGAPCCPTGDAHGTFITAVLVSESSCHWPPDTKVRYLDS